MSDYLDSVAVNTTPGRPPSLSVSDSEAVALRRAYIKSNRARDLGTMSGAAMYTACDPRSVLSDATRQAIKAAHRANRALPVEIRRALRASQAAVVHYRDPGELSLRGIHAVGCMRMVREPDGTLRRLRPGERWSVDDASVNFGVCVPWPWGGDPCSRKYGVRVGRFQLLAAIDDATHYCPGWGYTIRLRDSYRSQDVVWTLAGIMRHAYIPECVVLEGGAWQAERTMAFIAAAGLRWEDAKGRPHSKLIENWLNDLWNPLAMESNGQIGRYRGEMQRETDLWGKARAGTIDPRRVFPMLGDALNAVQRAVEYKNAEKTVHSKIYGSWNPAEDHAEGLKACQRPAMGSEFDFLAARVRRELTVLRFGQVAAAAMSPLGDAHRYVFAGDALVAWHRARVWVHFDPFVSPVRAHVTLAKAFRDTPAGTLIAGDLPCLTDAPQLIRDSSGYRIEFADGLAEAARVKRLAGAVVRHELRVTSLDGARVTAVSEISAPDGVDQQQGIGRTTQPDFDAIRAARRAETDMAELEAFEAAQKAG